MSVTVQKQSIVSFDVKALVGNWQSTQIDWLNFYLVPTNHFEFKPKTVLFSSFQLILISNIYFSVTLHIVFFSCNVAIDFCDFCAMHSFTMGVGLSKEKKNQQNDLFKSSAFS